MVENITFSTIAQEEFEKSVLWYEGNSVGLGRRFADAIDQAIKAISLNPEAYIKIKSEYRQFVVDKFPFVIIYEIFERKSTINILHIFHTSRNPKLKFRKK
jgi:plasmid stabilization system protein ParE